MEGIHDAALVERVWGHDLRVEGIVVEPIDGLDNLPEAVAEFRPGATRRLGVLVDHLVPRSKESRIADSVLAEFGHSVLITGHPYIDIWQAVRPAAVGIKSWPDVPRGDRLEDRSLRGAGHFRHPGDVGPGERRRPELPGSGHAVDHRGGAAHRLRRGAGPG